MITICTVLVDSIKKYLDIMVESAVKNTSAVTEILVAKVDETDVEEVYKEGNIAINIFPHFVEDPWYGHALGLHACIERVKTEYILFCDPDIFFLKDTDKFYLDLINKYNINYIGCSHECATAEAYHFFPYVVNSLVKKSDLPDENFLKGKLKYRKNPNDSIGILRVPALKHDDYPLATGKYLIQSPIPGLFDSFPSPNAKPPKYDCDYDTSCNLCLWSQEKNWRWLSFQTLDRHYYTSKYKRSNFKLKDKLEDRKLIYHAVGSAREGSDDKYESFVKAYKENK